MTPLAAISLAEPPMASPVAVARPRAEAATVPAQLPARQRTLKTAIRANGVGLHSGTRASIRLVPAPANHGIVFLRTDTGTRIPARHDHVVDTRLCTVLGLPGSTDPATRISTVEHVMAALAGAGIDNALIEVSGPEIPIMDGSAAPFTFLIDCAGVTAQDAPLSVLQVLRPIRVKDGEATVALLPSARAAVREEGARLALAIEIDFTAAAIGRQDFALELTPAGFREAVAPARTFGFAEDLQRLRDAGLARGGSLDNAVVLEDGKVVNEGGLRFADEFARHKLLDAVGDLALAGLPIEGRFVGHRSGHRLNNQLLRALFEAPDAFRIVQVGAKPRRAPAATAARQGMAAAHVAVA
jgi:UDP-3-O-[3-hydroxymyristoyl] N-acetylglucosamine deacetylase